MSRRNDLEANIQQSYKLIIAYEERIRLSDNEKEKMRSQVIIDEQWILIKEYLDEYVTLFKVLHFEIPENLKELVARFPLYSDILKPGANGSSQQSSKKVLEIFFSYAHEDELLLKKLKKQLSLLEWEGLIKSWYDREVIPGKEWAREIDTHLNTSHIILLLISADFMASNYCYGIEMKRALERHEAGEAKVIPVILRAVDWRKAPFSKLYVLPKDGLPITSWKNRDEALLDVAQGIRKAVEEFIVS